MKKALKIVAKHNIDYTYNGKVIAIKKGDEFILYGKVFAYKDALIDITSIIDCFETTVMPEPPVGLPVFEITANLILISSVDGSKFELKKGSKFSTVNDIVWFANGVILNIAEHTDCIKFVGYTGDPIPVESVELDETEVTLAIAGTKQLTATVLPDDATDPSVTWTSSNEAVATVDENGLVTAVAAGEAKITATAGDKFAECSVEVTA